MDTADPMHERIATVERRMQRLQQALDNVDIDDPQQVRGIALAIRWAQERQLAASARTSDMRRNILTAGFTLAGTVAGAFLLRYLGLGK